MNTSVRALQEDAFKMVEKITSSQIEDLALSAASSSIETIALRYLQFTGDEIKNLKDLHRGASAPFIRDIIEKWAKKNQDLPDQAKVFTPSH